MPIKLKVDNNPYQQKLPTINGVSLYITVMYNTSDDFYAEGAGSWYFDLVDRNGKNLISSVKILPNQNLTKRYLHLNSLLGGSLWCVNVKDTVNNDFGRDNFSTDGKFQLWYFSDQEMEQYQI